MLEYPVMMQEDMNEEPMVKLNSKLFDSHNIVEILRNETSNS
jgi:hypothetical protein